MTSSLFNRLMKDVADPMSHKTKVKLKVINHDEKIKEKPELVSKLQEVHYKQRRLLQATFSAHGKQNLVMTGSLTDIKKILRVRHNINKENAQ